MNRCVAVLSIFTAVGLFASSFAAGQRRAIEPDLAKLASGQGLRVTVTNRRVTGFTDGARQVSAVQRVLGAMR